MFFFLKNIDREVAEVPEVIHVVLHVQNHVICQKVNRQPVQSHVPTQNLKNVLQNPVPDHIKDLNLVQILKKTMQINVPALDL